MNWQGYFLVEENNTYYFCGNWRTTKDFEDKKDSRIKKTLNIPNVNHNSSSSDKFNQSGQTNSTLG